MLQRIANNQNVMPSLLGQLLADGFFGDSRLAGLRGDDEWRPAVEISENEREAEIQLEVAGVSRDRIGVETQGDTLTVTGRALEGDDAQRRGFRGRAFRRSFTLPDTYDLQRAQARCADGLLTVTVPRREPQAQERRQIEIG